MIRTLVEELVKQIVDNDEDVAVTQEAGETTLLLSIHVKKSDLAYVIGKRGVIINSIRTIMQAIGSKNKQRVIIELLE